MVSTLSNHVQCPRPHAIAFEDQILQVYVLAANRSMIAIGPIQLPFRSLRQLSYGRVYHEVRKIGQRSVHTLVAEFVLAYGFVTLFLFQLDCHF